MELTENTANNQDSNTPCVFGPKDILQEIIAVFLDETYCRQWVLKKLHPGEPICPNCGIPISDETRLQRFWSGSRLNCRRCRMFFTALTGTFLAGSHFDFRETILISILLGFEIDNWKIAEVLDVTQETVRLWKKRFEAIERGRQLHGN
jgi:transposase-like protein